MAARSPRGPSRHASPAALRCRSCGRLPRASDLPPTSGVELIRLCTKCGRAEQNPTGRVGDRRTVKGYAVQCFVCARWGLLPIPVGIGIRPEHIVCPRCQTRWPKRPILPYPRLRPARRKTDAPAQGSAPAGKGALRGAARWALRPRLPRLNRPPRTVPRAPVDL
jgi:hypothetical protein